MANCPYRWKVGGRLFVTRIEADLYCVGLDKIHQAHPSQVPEAPTVEPIKY